MNKDDLIEELMKIEDPFIRESIKLRKAQKQGNRKKEPEYQFQKGHNRASTAKIEQLMKMRLSIEDIKQERESKRGETEFWRTNEILDDIKEEQKRLEEAEKRLAFSKVTQPRLGEDSLVKLREEKLVEDILSNVTSIPKSGAKKKKKKKKFTKKKKPSKKSEHKKKKTQTGGYPFWFDDVPKGMSRAQYKRLEKSKPKNKSMKVWIRENKKNMKKFTKKKKSKK